MISQGSTSFEWPVSVKTGLEKPRWVILAFQTERTSQTSQIRNGVFKKLEEASWNEKLVEELHKPVRRKCLQCRVNRINDIWGADLVEMQEWEKNEGFCYMLNITNAFSKFAWSERLKGKRAKAVLVAFKCTVPFTYILQDSSEELIAESFYKCSRKRNKKFLESRKL